MLTEAGFRHASSRVLAMVWPFEDTGAFLRYWLEGENPVPRGLVAGWKARRGGGFGGVEKRVAEVC